MASATGEQIPTQNNTGAFSAGRGGGRRRGGGNGGGEDRANRGRGRGGRAGSDGATGTGRRGGARKPRGIGRGADSNPNAHQSEDSNGSAQTVLRLAPGSPPVARKSDDAASDDTESEICFICADPVRYIAMPPCNHPTCHICSLRMRALYKSKTCAHCRIESEYVIFTKEHDKLFEGFKDSEIIAQNAALGIKYDDQAICDDATLLLRYNCPEETCDRACLGWPDLHRHVKHEHNRVMCDLCTRHKKVFTHEHELFTAAELRRHERHGDDQPGSGNQSGFKGHPECQFCNQRFYSVDELFIHCRDKHERCHICERSRPADQQPQYYFNYDTLEAHFRKAHYVCPDSQCLEKKFVVFEYEIDLKAHQLEVHPNGLSKTAMRDARRIDISHFQDARSVQPQNDGQRRGRGGRGGGGGRGRPELEDPPVRTAQHMSRAEIAFHRTQQLAIQSAQSTTSRTFGGQLSEPSFAARPAPQPARPPQTQSVELPQPRAPGQVPGNIPALPRTITPPTNNAAFPPLSAARPANLARPSQPAQPAQNLTDARVLRHAAVIERASNMLRNDTTKMQLFRNDISKFRSGVITGDNLVDMLWSLFDASAKELNTLINEVAELYEDEVKKKELLKAWNNWKAINEDYPPIAGASSQSASTSTNATRVLKLKSSTARSSRSAAASAWGTAAITTPTYSPSSSASSVPPKPIVNPNRVGKGAVGATPWVTQPPAPAPPTSTAYTFPASSSSSSAAPTVRPIGRDEFPSLPPKKHSAGWTPIPNRAPVVTNNPWVPGSPEVALDEADNAVENGGGGGKKKKGKQKQLLFHVGL